MAGLLLAAMCAQMPGCHAGPTGLRWIYALIGVLATGFIWLRVPETKGRSLEHIELQVHGQPMQAA